MRLLAFTKRTTKEILLDPLSVGFGLGFPVVLIFLLSAINSGIPKGYGPDNFEIQNLAPSVSVFGLSFITLFSALLVSKDRSSSLLTRLFTTPLTSIDYILGYLIPLIPISLAQGIVCYLLALILGLPFTVNILWCLLSGMVIAILFASMGLLCGSVLNDKQVGGLCGALLTNLTAWFSGAWFSLEMVGGAFEAIGKVLPFYHAVEMQKAILSGNFADIFDGGHLWFVLGYTVAICVAAVVVFTMKMREK